MQPRVIGVARGRCNLDLKVGSRVTVTPTNIVAEFSRERAGHGPTSLSRGRGGSASAAKSAAFHRFLKMSWNSPDAPGGNPANDKFGESDAHAALARRSRASKPN